MRITIVQGAFFPVPPLRGGATEKLWHALGCEFARRGHGVTHLSRLWGELGKDERLGGVRHLRVRGYEQPSGLVLLKLLDLLYTLRVRRILPAGEIVVSNTFWLPILGVPSRCGRLVVSVERMPRGQMRLYRRAGLLRACSSAVERAILREDPGARGRTVTIPNPLILSVRGDVDLGGKSRVILYAGRVHPEKGVHLLIGAFARGCKSALEGWRLRVVGPWEVDRGGGGVTYKERLVALAGDAPVEWVGPIDDVGELEREYADASVFCYPSNARGEAMPVAPLEAMAWGCVPVVSELEVFGDYIRNGENGIVVGCRGVGGEESLAGALCAVAGDSEWRERMARSAEGVRVTHDLGRVSERFLEEFVNLGRERSSVRSVA